MKYNAFYGYDGNGDWAYKLTGVTSIDQYNAGQETFHMHFNDAVLYVNPYFVVTPRGYTRHYYNGSRRIAAQTGALSDLPDNIIDTSAVAMERMGNARSYMQSLFSQDIALEPDTTSTFVDIDGDAYDELQWQCTEDDLAWHVDIQCDSDILLPVLTKDPSLLNDSVSGIYFYHPDHLGSATWITHRYEAVQFIHYMPFGEMWCNQQGSAYDERFKFTGKERDEETGYDYFGARYYLSSLPLWLSVDPLADKYPNISPYAYAAWNPVKYVDPDGKGVFPSKEALRQAGENVVNNPNYQRQGRTTFCNIGAQAINAQAGDRSLLGRANEMGISLRNPEIATEISQSEALEYANMGAVVFASYVSNGGEPGHIAIVAPTEGLTYSPTRNESVVSVFNVGSQNGEMPLSYAFGKRSVGMFIFNNDLNTLKGISTSNGGNFQEIPVGGINEIVVTGKGTTKLEVPIKAIDVKLPNANLNL